METALGFGVDALYQLMEVHEHDMSIKFADYTQERDAPVQMYSHFCPHILIQGDNLEISHVLWYTSFSPALLSNRRVFLQCLIKSGRMATLPGALP